MVEILNNGKFDMSYLLLSFLIVSLFLEGTVTALPLVLVGLVCLTIFNRSFFMFFLAFAAGIVLDVFAVRAIGETSILFLILVFLMLLYQRKYEINSYPFVLIASFVGALVYLFIFGYTNIIEQSILCAMIAVILFGFSRYIMQQFPM